ncbi:MAG: VPLPA-CTERM sorting domain-containing protein [Paracoccaceae bacterium]|nr:VPLPA-CTERM sorting domain-containing protein [Paracoccaceae bacterium]
MSLLTIKLVTKSRAIGLAGMLSIAALSAHAASLVTVFTDQALFEAAIATPVTEDFNGDRVEFADNSKRNPVGLQTTVDVIGGFDDDSFNGIDGNGFFNGEVDSSLVGSGDGESYVFNTGPIFGFGLVGLQNDNLTDPAGLDLEEIGISFGTESFLLSDILGLTNSSDGQNVNSVENTDPVFVGFLSTDAQFGFSLFHGDDVAPGGVDGGNERFFLDALIVDVAPVPLPAGLPLLLGGLGAMAFLRRKARRAPHAQA